MSDPLHRQLKKARRNSPFGKLEALLAEESRWKRKRTIAENKLAAVRSNINQLARAHALELSGVKPEVAQLVSEVGL